MRESSLSDSAAGDLMIRATQKVIFPRAFALAIDDLGWNDGRNMLYDKTPGPYRVGIKRHFDLDDYQVIVNVGKAVGARIQSLFVLSEMDRENVLSRYPTTTYQRGRWDNSHRVSDEQVEIMIYVRDASAYMEFGMHGTGHEHWADDGIQRRAEWYNMADRQPWPEDVLRTHMQAFAEIMAQYGLSPDEGHSFPESFVPCAYSCFWNPDGDYSLPMLAGEMGVKYMNTDFAMVPELSPPPGVNAGGFDHGVHVINRMNYGNLWYEVGTLPKVTLDMQHTDVIESHWANWLAADDFLQHDVTKRWIDYYRRVQREPDRYIAKNTEQLHAQWLYNHYTVIVHKGDNTIQIDNTAMPVEAYHRDILGTLVLKLPCPDDLHLSHATLNGSSIPACCREAGYLFLYLPQLDRQHYELRYALGTQPPENTVWLDGTFNVYNVISEEGELVVDLKMYGSQDVKIWCKRPEKVVSATKQLRVDRFRYIEDAGMAIVALTATDFQGARGRIRMLLR